MDTETQNTNVGGFLMNRLYLINEMDHDLPDIQGYMVGNEDYPLTDLGRLRARIAKTQLSEHSFEHVYTSPLARCKDAAQEIFGQAEISEELTDAYLGHWQGHGLDEIQAQWPEEYKQWLYNPVSDPPGAEPNKERAKRLNDYLSDKASHASGDLAFFTHHGIIVPFLGRILELPDDKLTQVRIPYGSVTILEWDGSAFQILSSGDQIIPELDDSIITLILDYYDVPINERQRCDRIAEKAYAWATDLSNTGLLLDADTVKAAARLQSIGGTDQAGAELGSRILDTMGYSDAAFAVLNHIQIFFRSIINEAVILYLANRIFPDATERTYAEVFQKDREQDPAHANDRIELDHVIINMINALYGSAFIPLDD